MRMQVAVTTKSLFALLILMIFGLSPTKAGYKAIDIGTLGGKISDAEGINALGQVVGLAQTGNGADHAILYNFGQKLIDLGTLGGARSNATSIDDNGEIVGSSLIKPGDPFTTHAFLYKNGKMVDIGVIGGIYSNVYFIRDPGLVVGQTDTKKPGDRHAFREDVSGIGRVMKDLGTLGGNTSAAKGINNLGHIVGYSNLKLNGPVHAFYYSINQMQDLGFGDFSQATAINDRDQIVGLFYPAGKNVSHGFLYNFIGGESTDLKTLGGPQSSALAINNAGDVVGWSNITPGNLLTTHAFIYSHGKMTDLNNLLNPGSPFKVLTVAEGIGDNGWIVGKGVLANGQTHGFVLIPAPEPASLTLISLGGLGLLAYGWRHRHGNGRIAELARQER